MTLAIGAFGLALTLVAFVSLYLAFEGAVNGSTYPRRRDRVALRLITLAWLSAIATAFSWGLGSAIVEALS